MFDRAFEKMSQQVEALLGPAAPGDAPLDELIHVHVAALAADPWVPQLIAREVLARDTPLRERFRERVHEGPMTVMIRWIEAQKERGYLAGDVDPELTAMSIAALAVFPYLLVPIVGSHIGVELNDEFRDRLVAHNQRLVSHGIRPRSGEVA
jgi:AcrR family transcriptional regulator